MKSVISLSLTVIFAFTQILFAHKPETSLWTERRQARTEASLAMASRPGQLGLPASPALNAVLSAKTIPSLPLPAGSRERRALEKLLSAIDSRTASVRRVRLPAGTRPLRGVVLHIQDVHLNAEAQKNISSLLTPLLAGGHVDRLALEGEFGSSDFLRLRRFAPADHLAAAADYLLENGKISGAVRAYLTLPPSSTARLDGIDDPAAYAANVDAVLTSNKARAMVAERLADVRARIEREKAVFSPALREADDYFEKRDAGAALLTDGVRLMARHLPLSPELRKFADAARIEGELDWDRVERERRTLLEKLAPKLSQPDMDRLMAASVAFRAGQISHRDFYAQLADVCARANCRFADFPALAEYVRYLTLAESIDTERLFADLVAAESTLYTRLARTADEAALVRRLRALRWTEKLVRFELTRADWNARPADADLPVNAAGLSSFINFYTQAVARDDAMSAKTAALFSAPQDLTVVALVTGGFHSEGVTPALLEQGLAVVTVTPRLTKIEHGDGSAYLSAFAQERTPLEKLHRGEKLFLSPDPKAGVAFIPAMIVGLAYALGRVTGLVDLYRRLSASPVLALEADGPAAAFSLRIATPDGEITARMGADISAPRPRVTNFDQSAEPARATPHTWASLAGSMLAPLAVIVLTAALLSMVNPTLAAALRDVRTWITLGIGTFGIGLGMAIQRAASPAPHTPGPLETYLRSLNHAGLIDALLRFSLWTLQGTKKIEAADRERSKGALTQLAEIAVRSAERLGEHEIEGLIEVIALIPDAEKRQSLLEEFFRNEKQERTLYLGILNNRSLTAEDKAHLRVHAREVMANQTARILAYGLNRGPQPGDTWISILNTVVADAPDNWKDLLIAYAGWFSNPYTDASTWDHLIVAIGDRSRDEAAHFRSVADLAEGIRNSGIRESWRTSALLAIGEAVAEVFNADTFLTVDVLTPEMPGWSFLSNWLVRDERRRNYLMAHLNLIEAANQTGGFDHPGQVFLVEDLIALRRLGALTFIDPILDVAAWAGWRFDSEMENHIAMPARRYVDERLLAATSFAFPGQLMVGQLHRWRDGLTSLDPSTLTTDERRLNAQRARRGAWNVQYLLGHPRYRRSLTAIPIFSTHGDDARRLLIDITRVLLARLSAPATPEDSQPHSRAALLREQFSLLMETLETVFASLPDNAPQDERAEAAFFRQELRDVLALYPNAPAELRAQLFEVTAPTPPATPPASLAHVILTRTLGLPNDEAVQDAGMAWAYFEIAGLSSMAVLVNPFWLLAAALILAVLHAAAETLGARPSERGFLEATFGYMKIFSLYVLAAMFSSEGFWIAVIVPALVHRHVDIAAIYGDDSVSGGASIDVAGRRRAFAVPLFAGFPGDWIAMSSRPPEDGGDAREHALEEFLAAQASSDTLGVLDALLAGLQIRGIPLDSATRAALQPFLINIAEKAIRGEPVTSGSDLVNLAQCIALIPEPSERYRLLNELFATEGHGHSFYVRTAMDFGVAEETPAYQRIHFREITEHPGARERLAQRPMDASHFSQPEVGPRLLRRLLESRPPGWTESLVGWVNWISLFRSDELSGWHSFVSILTDELRHQESTGYGSDDVSEVLVRAIPGRNLALLAQRMMDGVVDIFRLEYFFVSDGYDEPTLLWVAGDQIDERSGRVDEFVASRLAILRTEPRVDHPGPRAFLNVFKNLVQMGALVPAGDLLDMAAAPEYADDPEVASNRAHELLMQGIAPEVDGGATALRIGLQEALSSWQNLARIAENITDETASEARRLYAFHQMARLLVRFQYVASAARPGSGAFHTLVPAEMWRSVVRLIPWIGAMITRSQAPELREQWTPALDYALEAQWNTLIETIAAAAGSRSPHAQIAHDMAIALLQNNLAPLDMRTAAQQRIRQAYEERPAPADPHSLVYIIVARWLGVDRWWVRPLGMAWAIIEAAGLAYSAAALPPIIVLALIAALSGAHVYFSKTGAEPSPYSARMIFLGHMRFFILYFLSALLIQQGIWLAIPAAATLHLIADVRLIFDPQFHHELYMDQAQGSDSSAGAVQKSRSLLTEELAARLRAAAANGTAAATLEEAVRFARRAPYDNLADTLIDAFDHLFSNGASVDEATRRRLQPLLIEHARTLIDRTWNLDPTATRAVVECVALIPDAGLRRQLRDLFFAREHHHHDSYLTALVLNFNLEPGRGHLRAHFREITEHPLFGELLGNEHHNPLSGIFTTSRLSVLLAARPQHWQDEVIALINWLYRHRRAHPGGLNLVTDQIANEILRSESLDGVEDILRAASVPEDERQRIADRVMHHIAYFLSADYFLANPQHPNAPRLRPEPGPRYEHADALLTFLQSNAHLIELGNFRGVTDHPGQQAFIKVAARLMDLGAEAPVRFLLDLAAWPGFVADSEVDEVHSRPAHALLAEQYERNPDPFYAFVAGAPAAWRESVSALNNPEVSLRARRYAAQRARRTLWALQYLTGHSRYRWDQRPGLASRDRFARELRTGALLRMLELAGMVLTDVQGRGDEPSFVLAAAREQWEMMVDTVATVLQARRQIDDELYRGAFDVVQNITTLSDADRTSAFRRLTDAISQIDNADAPGADGARARSRRALSLLQDTLVKEAASARNGGATAYYRRLAGRFAQDFVEQMNTLFDEMNIDAAPARAALEEAVRDVVAILRMTAGDIGDAENEYEDSPLSRTAVLVRAVAILNERLAAHPRDGHILQMVRARGWRYNLTLIVLDEPAADASAAEEPRAEALGGNAAPNAAVEPPAGIAVGAPPAPLTPAMNIPSFVPIFPRMTIGAIATTVLLETALFHYIGLYLVGGYIGMAWAVIGLIAIHYLDETERDLLGTPWGQTALGMRTILAMVFAWVYFAGGDYGLIAVFAAHFTWDLISARYLNGWAIMMAQRKKPLTPDELIEKFDDKPGPKTARPIVDAIATFTPEQRRDALDSFAAYFESLENPDARHRFMIPLLYEFAFNSGDERWATLAENVLENAGIPNPATEPDVFISLWNILSTRGEDAAGDRAEEDVIRNMAHLWDFVLRDPAHRHIRSRMEADARQSAFAARAGIVSILRETGSMIISLDHAERRWRIDFVTAHIERRDPAIDDPQNNEVSLGPWVEIIRPDLTFEENRRLTQYADRPDLAKIAETRGRLTTLELEVLSGGAAIIELGPRVEAAFTAGNDERLRTVAHGVGAINQALSTGNDPEEPLMHLYYLFTHTPIDPSLAFRGEVAANLSRALERVIDRTDNLPAAATFAIAYLVALHPDAATRLDLVNRFLDNLNHHHDYYPLLLWFDLLAVPEHGFLRTHAREITEHPTFGGLLGGNFHFGDDTTEEAFIYERAPAWLVALVREQTDRWQDGVLVLLRLIGADRNIRRQLLDPLRAAIGGQVRAELSDSNVGVRLINGLLELAFPNDGLRARILGSAHSALYAAFHPDYFAAPPMNPAEAPLSLAGETDAQRDDRMVAYLLTRLADLETANEIGADDLRQIDFVQAMRRLQDAGVPVNVSKLLDLTAWPGFRSDARLMELVAAPAGDIVREEARRRPRAAADALQGARLEWTQAIDRLIDTAGQFSEARRRYSAQEARRAGWRILFLLEDPQLGAATRAEAASAILSMLAAIAPHLPRGREPKDEARRRTRRFIREQWDLVMRIAEIHYQRVMDDPQGAQDARQFRTGFLDELKRAPGLSRAARQDAIGRLTERTQDGNAANSLLHVILVHTFGLRNEGWVKAAGLAFGVAEMAGIAALAYFFPDQLWIAGAFIVALGGLHVLAARNGRRPDRRTVIAVAGTYAGIFSVYLVAMAFMWYGLVGGWILIIPILYHLNADLKATYGLAGTRHLGDYLLHAFEELVSILNIPPYLVMMVLETDSALSNEQASRLRFAGGRPDVGDRVAEAFEFIDTLRPRIALTTLQEVLGILGDVEGAFSPEIRSRIEPALTRVIERILFRTRMLMLSETSTLVTAIALLPSAEARRRRMDAFRASWRFHHDYYPRLLVSPLIAHPNYGFLRVHARELAEHPEWSMLLRNPVHSPGRMEMRPGVIDRLLRERPAHWQDGLAAIFAWVAPRDDAQEIWDEITHIVMDAILREEGAGRAPEDIVRAIQDLRIPRERRAELADAIMQSLSRLFVLDYFLLPNGQDLPRLYVEDESETARLLRLRTTVTRHAAELEAIRGLPYADHPSLYSFVRFSEDLVEAGAEAPDGALFQFMRAEFVHDAETLPLVRRAHALLTGDLARDPQNVAWHALVITQDLGRALQDVENTEGDLTPAMQRFASYQIGLLLGRLRYLARHDDFQPLDFPPNWPAAVPDHIWLNAVSSLVTLRRLHYPAQADHWREATEFVRALLIMRPDLAPRIRETWTGSHTALEKLLGGFRQTTPVENLPDAERATARINRLRAAIEAAATSGERRELALAATQDILSMFQRLLDQRATLPSQSPEIKVVETSLEQLKRSILEAIDLLLAASTARREILADMRLALTEMIKLGRTVRLGSREVEDLDREVTAPLFAIVHRINGAFYRDSDPQWRLDLSRRPNVGYRLVNLRAPKPGPAGAASLLYLILTRTLGFRPTPIIKAIGAAWAVGEMLALTALAYFFRDSLWMAGAAAAALIVLHTLAATSGANPVRGSPLPVAGAYLPLFALYFAAAAAAAASGFLPLLAVPVLAHIAIDIRALFFVEEAAERIADRTLEMDRAYRLGDHTLTMAQKDWLARVVENSAARPQNLGVRDAMNGPAYWLSLAQAAAYESADKSGRDVNAAGVRAGILHVFDREDLALAATLAQAARDGEVKGLIVVMHNPDLDVAARDALKGLDDETATLVGIGDLPYDADRGLYRYDDVLALAAGRGVRVAREILDSNAAVGVDVVSRHVVPFEASAEIARVINLLINLGDGWARVDLSTVLEAARLARIQA